MKVSTNKTVDLELDVDITIEDIKSTINEMAYVAEHSDYICAVLEFYSAVYQCVRACPDEVIQKLSVSHKENIRNAFREQLGRVKD